MDFWRFAPDGRVGSLIATHSTPLVVLSVAVAALAAYTALAVVNRIAVSPTTQHRRAWLAMGAGAMGCGIWAMHFIAMIALQLPVPTTFAFGWTVASIGPAVLGSGLMLHAMARDQIGLRHLLLAGLLVATGIGSMHYMGMEAITADARMSYDPVLFGLSIAVAFALASLALFARFALHTHGPAEWRRMAGALLMGGAVSGMHYTAMAAVHFAPTGAHHVVGAIGHAGLAIAVLLAVSVIIGLALLATVVDRRVVEAMRVAADSESRHRVMLEAIAEGVLAIGPSGSIEGSNPAAERMLGYSAAALAGRRLTDLFELGARDPAAIVDALVLKPIQANARRQDGSTFPAELHVYQLHLAGETVANVLVTDMSAARAAELERRQQAAALQQAAEAIFIAARSGAIEYANPAFERITGFGRDECLGQTPRLLKSGDNPSGLYTELWDTITRGEVWSGVIRNRRKDGSLFELAQTISPIRDEQGTITHFVAVGRDVTEQKSLELQLRQAQKLEAIGQLAAGIAHEINTPTQYVGDNIRFLQTAFVDLARVLGALRPLPALQGSEAEAARRHSDQVIEEADADYLVLEIPRAIDQALDGVKRVATIVRAMKDFSHPGVGKGLIDLNRAIRSTVAVTTHEWKYVAVVEPDLDEALPPVPCMGGEINQVVLNLIVNAAQAIEAARAGIGGKGVIRITTRAEDGSAVIRVADNGTGIPKAAQSRVFEPFFTTKEVGKGTGQGLAFAHAVVTKGHGGSIEFETEIGKGTVFTIRLPLDGSLESAA